MFRNALLVAAVAVTGMTGIQAAHAAGPAGYARGLVHAPVIASMVSRKSSGALPFAELRGCVEGASACELPTEHGFAMAFADTVPVAADREIITGAIPRLFATVYLSKRDRMAPSDANRFDTGRIHSDDADVRSAADLLSGMDALTFLDADL